MKPTTVLDGRLWPRLGFGHAPTENLKFSNDLRNQGHFATQALLYDKIIFPTNDFGIVPILVHWLGLKKFLNAVENDNFSFLRRIGILTYGGNGNGIDTIEIHPGPNSPLYYWQEALFGDTEKSLALQVENSEIIPSKERRFIKNLVQKVSIDFKCDNDFFLKNIVNESYKDIVDSLELSNFILNSINPRTGSVSLNRLPGIEPNQVKCSFLLGAINNPIELVLRVAEVNLEIAMSAFIGNCDLFTCEGTDKLLANKIRRAIGTKNFNKGFLTLLELNKIPDIEYGIYNNKCSLTDIWTFRETKTSRLFRKWLRDANAENIRDLEKEYIATISKIPMVASLPIRIIRFCLTNLCGVVDPAIGLGVSLADSFYVEKLLSGYNPKLFFDKLRKINPSTVS